MKSMKKLLAIALVLVMLSGLAITASAATITITQNAPEGYTAGNESYVAYKIFDVTKTEDVEEDVTTDATIGPGTKEGFSYTIPANSAWLTAVQGTGIFDLTLSADKTVYSVAIKEGKNTEADAKTAAAYLLANAPSSAAKIEFTTSDCPKEVDDGYYLITSSLGTNLVLATSNINITTKNEYIDDDKKAEKSNYNVGDDVAYTITVNIPASVDETKPAVVHDTLPPEFDFNDDVAATVDGSAFTAFEVNTDPTDDCTFEVTLTLTGMAGKSIVLTYSAEVTNRAVSDTGYINTEFTSYSNYTTKPKTVEVKTYDFDLEKTDGDGEPLDGAVFELRETADGDAIEFIKVDGGYERADSTQKAADKVTELEAGAINIGGLAAGTYYLVELEAPAGYNKLAGPIIVVIADDGTVTLDGSSDSQGSLDESKITVENLAGTVLPSTGGIGTTLFYVFGTLLVLGAGVVLVTKRRVRE